MFPVGTISTIRKNPFKLKQKNAQRTVSTVWITFLKNP